jgi:small subunit ribosomal protein S16
MIYVSCLLELTFIGEGMVQVRLSLQGTHKRPFYHIVVADHRKPRNGRFLEKIGYYDPACEPSLIEIKKDRLGYWFSKGAGMTNTVAKLIKSKNIILDRKSGVV